MNKLFTPVNQLITGKTFLNQPFISLPDTIKGEFILVIDHADQPHTSDPRDLFTSNMFNKSLCYRGFPYQEQIEKSLADKEIHGLYIHVKEPLTSFQDKHFNEQSFILNTRRGKYKKPVILHIHTNQLEQSEIFQKNANVVLVRKEMFGKIEIECVKNNLLH